MKRKIEKWERESKEIEIVNPRYIKKKKKEREKKIREKEEKEVMHPMLGESVRESKR